ncbi:MAG: 2-dehydropantoate 2-reductase [Candidatus Omnitrophica bacterium]|nr:2-dehydropantoate 2-reductase [Candidatus Omnitrophota bacterium]
MKITVVGPGALGCLIAALLKNKTKDEIWLLDEFADRARKISLEGIKVEGMSGPFTVKVNATANVNDIGSCDLVILCVKSYSTEDACKGIKDLVSEKTGVLTLQNGIGNIQILNDYFGPERVIAGVTNHGSTLIETAHVRHAGKGDTIIGKADGRVLGAIREVAGILTKAGFEAKVSKDIDSVIWSKLVVNVGINALTAITRLNNGALIEHEECRQILRSAVQEAVKVVKRKRIKLLYDDPIQKVESVCRATSSNVSSMLQDILNKKRTEIDFINGAIVRQAKALNIPTPVNEVLTNLVKTIEKNREKRAKEK